MIGEGGKSEMSCLFLQPRQPHPQRPEGGRGRGARSRGLDVAPPAGPPVDLGKAGEDGGRGGGEGGKRGGEDEEEETTHLKGHRGIEGASTRRRMRNCNDIKETAQTVARSKSRAEKV